VTGPKPFLVAQLSDPHVSDGDDDRGRLLADAVRAVAALDPAPGAVLVTGDLAEHGSAREYERVRELLSALAMPVHVLPGNHDHRDALRASFPLPDADAGSEDYRYATRCGPLRLVGCDTIQPGRDDGRLGPERLAWLDGRLAEDRETPTIVATHHLPLLMGIRAWDEIGLPDADRAGLADVIARHPQVQRIVAGHVHRTVIGGLSGCPVFACPSTWIQSLLDFGHPDRLALVPEPPGFALHVAVAGELVSHVQPVGEW
jgi:3',5'-cyclic-AMP phosphodiesterase